MRSPHVISNELGLVAACCRWPATEARDATVSQAATGAIDWDLVERVARRHRVTGQVHQALTAAKVAMPDVTAKRLADAAQGIRLKGLAMAREAIALQAAFDAAGCPVLFVKGASLAMLAYDDVGIKQAWDIDLLTAPDFAVRARDILESRGYAMVEPGPLSPSEFARFMELSKECVFLHPDKRIAVELHWKLVDNAHLIRGIDARSATQSVMIGGHALRTLQPVELLAYLMVHGTRHAWMRLKWLADVAALVSRYEVADRQALYLRLKMLEPGRAAAVALLLCHQLLDVDLPQALLAELRRDRATLRLVAVALTALTYGQGEEIPDDSLPALRIRLSQLEIAPGWRYLAAELGYIWMSPTDSLALALPRRLTPLYHVLRIPRWLVRRSGTLVHALAKSWGGAMRRSG